MLTPGVLIIGALITLYLWNLNPKQILVRAAILWVMVFIPMLGLIYNSGGFKELWDVFCTSGYAFIRLFWMFFSNGYCAILPFCKPN